ncbi:NAD(P)-binding protein [Hypoxylon sp. FL0890]|nr:NAD(P)-binding protein [Hypoxylon sp. FL0890]
MVMGGNAGIGYELCGILFVTGSTERAEASIQSIKSSYAKPDVMTSQLKFLHLDLSGLSSEENKLSVLRNNAEIALHGVHCGGALLLAELLLSQLWATISSELLSRDVWLTSIPVNTSAPRDGVNFAVLETDTRDQKTNYAASKAGTWVLGREFGRRHVPDGALSVVMSPGNLDVGSFRGTPQPVLEAYMELFAGQSPEVTRGTNSRCIFPWGRLIPDCSVSEELGGLGYGKKLWEWCETK